MRRTFNNSTGLIIIGSYPRKDCASQVLSGIPAYMRDLCGSLGPLLSAAEQPLIVLADKFPGDEPSYREGDMLVCRTWSRNSPAVFSQLLTHIARNFPAVEQVLIQFEFNLFGGAAVTAMFPAFLALLRLMGKRVYLVVHQVVEDLGELREHVGLEHSKVKFGIYQRILPRFYAAMARSAWRTAVHDDLLRNRMERMTRRPIAVIPHGCPESQTPWAREHARMNLGFGHDDLVLLCFGFMAHYKGSDWIAGEVAAYLRENKESKLRLVLAGGKSPNHCCKAYYERYYGGLLETAKAHPRNIFVTGYVPEAKIAAHFGAADLAVFPYRTHMAASGPFSRAISFGSAFLLSEPLRDTSAGADFARAVGDGGLAVDDVTFPLRSGKLLEKSAKLLQNQNKLHNIREISGSLSKARSWSTVAGIYREYLGRRPVSIPSLGRPAFDSLTEGAASPIV